METEITNLEQLQGILWSKPVAKLDLERDEIYIIHQVLSFGNLEQIKWLFKAYTSKEIEKVFLKNPKKIYTPAVFNFIKNIILGLEHKKLPNNRYVKTLPRVIK